MTTETPTSMTHYAAATHLLTNPKAKLSNSQRKDLRKARIVFADEALIELGGRPTTRADRRRKDKRLTQWPVVQPTRPKEGGAKILHRVAKKNIHQLRNAVLRGQRRALRFALLATLATAPKVRAALQQASMAFQDSAECAKAEHTRRTKFEVVE